MSWGVGWALSWDDCYSLLACAAVFHLFVALLYPLLAIELLGRLHSGLIVAFDWEHGNGDNVC